jgi:hypothetical protein
VTRFTNVIRQSAWSQNTHLPILKSASPKGNGTAALRIAADGLRRIAKRRITARRKIFRWLASKSSGFLPSFGRLDHLAESLATKEAMLGAPTR